MTAKLSERFPEVPADQLIAGFVPPPQFANVSLDSYIPDPAWPSQAAAVARLQELATGLAGPGSGKSAKSKKKRKLLGSKEQAKQSKAARNPGGVYLDGGFGVGKTHLLASLYYLAANGGDADGDERPQAAFGSFVEYTNLVGALGFEAALDALSEFQLVCIDEFELDDPGDTVLISSLLARLAERGVFLAATSNTLPDKLGEGRFAADDFLREIQGLSSIFEAIRIDGDDYRHRDLNQAPAPASEDEIAEAAARADSTRDSFAELLAHLAQVHPSRYGAMVREVETVCIDDVFTLDDQSRALRFVALVDRLYDAQVIIVAGGIPLDQVFSSEMLAGGFRKKYRRALSRLIAMAASD